MIEQELPCRLHMPLYCVVWSLVEFVVGALSALSENDCEFIHMISVRARQAEAS